MSTIQNQGHQALASGLSSVCSAVAAALALEELDRLRAIECLPTPEKLLEWAKRFRASDGNPLDLRTLDAMRLLESINCRVGPGRPWGSGMKHRTSCPWFEEHSHQANDDSGVLFMEPGRWPAWHCSHSHHSHLGLADLLEAAGVLQ